MKYKSNFSIFFVLMIFSFFFSQKALAAPVIDGWTADPGPDLITEGDESVLHLRAHNDGRYITCDISSPTGDAIVGREDTYGSTNVWLQNVGGGVYRFYRAFNPGATYIDLNEWVRVKPSGGSAGEARYRVDCRGGVNGTGAAAPSVPEVLVRVEGRVIETYLDGIDHQWASNTVSGDYACDTLAWMESTKQLRNCAFDFNPKPLVSAHTGIPPSANLSYPSDNSGRRALLKLYGFYKGYTASVSFSCDGLHRKVTGSVSGVVCPLPPPVNGSCGSSNGQTMPSAPTSGLCNMGSASAVTGSGPWNWTCAGSNGGSTASCVAYKTPPPSCGTNARTYLSTETGYGGTFCSAGMANPANPAFPAPGGTTNWTCSNAAGSASCAASRWSSLNPPSNLQASCNAAGNQVTLSWNGSPGADSYALRVDDLTNGWDGSCTSPDECRYVNATSYTRAVVPGRDYNWWVHAYRASDGQWSDAPSLNFRCNAPVNVSGRIYNRTTGVGRNVAVPACAANPGTTTDASGSFSFQTSYGSGFCIRPTFPDEAGVIGPKTVFTDPARSWVKTYEWQMAGRDCPTEKCDPTHPDAWDLWDRGVDSGYDFIFASPKIILAPNATSIPYNGSVSFTWSISDADFIVPNSCRQTSSPANAQWSGTNLPLVQAAPQTVNGLTQTTVFGLECIGIDGKTVSAEKTVNVASCVWDGGIVRTNPEPPQCMYNDPTCTAATCGKTLTGTLACVQTYTDNCGAPRTGNCQTNTCTPRTVTCPKCPGSPYKEVAP